MVRLSVATVFTSGGGVCSFQAGKSGCGFGDGGAPPQPSGSSGGSGSTGGTNGVPAGFDASVGDPAGAKNLGNGQGQQFITGACLSNADCASTCCAGLRGGAVCSGIGAQFQNGKTGCGFNGGAASPQPSAGSGNSGSAQGGTYNAAVPAGFDASVGDPAGAKHLGNGQAQQFITGACLSNADCASTCCAGLRGGAVCSGIGAQFQNGKTGCGFTTAKRSVDVSRVARRFRA
ncbi:biotrophy-associated secreted 2 [Trichoderma cornu-damae]|uniref:Biotrophy-associated secreted 2 n=1 Tax=Trichoderma cornu-damae TaxID=654480 RepID=A0A9P8QQK1_9HYPO|nr:biotrophy-associated secreted 2 [Trichoderma cornu-damae]